MTEAPSIRLSDVTVSYNRHPAVHHVSGSFAPGSFTAIIGPNGAGKSTLLKAIVGLVKADGGRIELTGIARDDIAYLPQQSTLDRSFPMRVFDLAAMGLWRRSGAVSRIAGKALDRVEAAIDAVGLAGFEDRTVGSLSGGQFQRALFARLLVQDSRLILLDEPFTAIDSRTTEMLLGVVQRWHLDQRTVVAVLHDLDLVRMTIPEALLISRDVVAWGPTRDVLSDANLLRARHLQEAFDEAAELCERPAA